MYVDIHTHHAAKANGIAIQSLSISEISISSDSKGYFSVGCHPWFSDQWSASVRKQIEQWLLDKRVVAIGECGLDKNCLVPFEKQLSIFEKQIELSEKKQKPMIIHCVGCFNEFFELKRRIKPSQLWILHGFRGKPQLAQQALQLGFGLSFGVRFNPESVKITPLEKLFIETDESELEIGEVYAAVAAAKGCRPEELMAGRLLLEQQQLK